MPIVSLRESREVLGTPQRLTRLGEGLRGQPDFSSSRRTIPRKSGTNGRQRLESPSNARDKVPIDAVQQNHPVFLSIVDKPAVSLSQHHGDVFRWSRH